MYSIIIHLSVLIYCSFQSTEALECGFGVGSSNSEIKRLADSCTNAIINDKDAASGGNDSTNSTRNYEQENKATAVDGEISRHAPNKQQKSRRSASTVKDSNATADDDRTKSVQQFADDDEEHKKCVVQCIFDTLKMTDDKGYPDHRKVSEGLLQKAGGRELRDFLQDSADACFQELKGSQLSACDYSVQLVGCLADRGKVNCADWPVGELPFAMGNGTKEIDGN